MTCTCLRLALTWWLRRSWQLSPGLCPHRAAPTGCCQHGPSSPSSLWFQIPRRTDARPGPWSQQPSVSHPYSPPPDEGPLCQHKQAALLVWQRLIGHSWNRKWNTLTCPEPLWHKKHHNKHFALPAARSWFWLWHKQLQMVGPVKPIRERSIPPLGHHMDDRKASL